MDNLKLIIANKKYSSWSLRPWLLLKAKGIDFEEVLSAFDFDNNNLKYLAFSPTKKVPVLHHREIVVWDSLSIMEYLAEIFPEKNLWPKDLKTRVLARNISHEMHSGFMALRNECPMNMCREPSKLALSEQALVDIERIESIWADCLNSYQGPFLFGEFTIADAMFAPVVNRLHVYQVDCKPTTQAYCETIKSMPAWQIWDKAAHEESWLVPQAEL